MNFTPSKADPDVWFHAAAKPDGFEYYEYMIVYVDDVLTISYQPKDIMDTLEKAYRLKEPALIPDIYLGATILPWTISGEKMWGMSSQRYIKEAIRSLEVELQKSGQCLTGKPNTPMAPGYHPY
jgi:hypothetical protein